MAPLTAGETEIGATGEADRLLYCVVKTDPPTAADFLSNAARDRPLRGSEVGKPELHTGLLMYDSEVVARATARRFPFLGVYLAIVRIPTGALVRVEQTLGEGHYTVWGAPDLLLTLVVAVVPV